MIDIGADRLGKSGDEFYDSLMAAHAGLGVEQCARLNARLVLLMANAIGDIVTLKAILAKAAAQ